MEAFEMPAIMAALVLAIAVVGAKAMTTQLLARMNRQISQVAQVRQEALTRLKTAQSQKNVVGKNLSILEKKKNKLAKQIAGLKKEMAELKEEEKARRQRSEARHIS